MKAEKIASPEMQPFELEHMETLRRLAPECMVLLKKNSDFPLNAPCRVALYGSGARRTVKGGTGSGDVNVRHYTTVEEGLEKAGFTITTKAWLDAYDEAKASGKEAFIASILEEAEREGKLPFLVGIGRTAPEPHYDFKTDYPGDICLYVLGRISGEGADRSANEGDFKLSEDEIRDILTCAKRYSKFMLVLNVGGVVDLSPVVDQVDNILLLSQLGTVTGDAFADVLLGKASPSGKLTDTWAKWEDYPHMGDFAQRDDTHYREGIYVGYRFFDAANKTPIFPFGYGLSYTDFEAHVLDFSAADGCVLVKAEVKNTGSYAGKETVLMYYSAPNGSLDKPMRELGAYQKTAELLPGQSQVLTLWLPIENMASWDTEKKTWVLEPGDYIIAIGNQQAGMIRLVEEVTGDALTAMDGGADFEDWKPEMICPAKPDQIPVIVIQAHELKKGHYDRNRISSSASANINLGSFSIEELAKTCVGKHSKARGIEGVIGSSSFTVSGAAAESDDVVSEKGFGRLILADGPAGLRINTRYIETENGPEQLDNGSMEELLPILGEEFSKKLLARRAAAREKAKIYPTYHHYASAIPIGLAIAQSWNEDLACACGSLVADEMNRFGINVWLAPAMNIHRSPLCGRNFEYFSEDPLVSGRVAAAITRGVQSHQGCAVTIKHFACNNQETNRFNSNSVVSERALREIYLKGFEICVKESAPLAVMSSYNLLGGIHTANRYDLLTQVLREEWGFDGIVMTDWTTTTTKQDPKGIYGPSSAAMCIKAGNDLIMPGCEADVEEIQKALESGQLTREELEICAGRVLRISKMLTVEEEEKHDEV